MKFRFQKVKNQSYRNQGIVEVLIFVKKRFTTFEFKWLSEDMTLEDKIKRIEVEQGLKF